jgi:FMN phosphatase YigB (HAD superfamily)
MTKNESRKKICEYLCSYKKNIPYNILREITDDLDKELMSMSFYTDTIPAMRALIARGYQLGIISNLAQPYGEVLRKKIADELEESMTQENMIFSYEVDHMKPEKEIFDVAVDNAGTTHEHSMMVGNHRINDTGAAINA